MLFRSLLWVLAAFALTNCAHHRDVRPGPSGVNEVILQTDGSEGYYQEARSQAIHYCDQFKKTPLVLKEKSRYKGTMDEKTYNNAKGASRAAMAVGSLASLGGNREVSNTGSAVALGGLGGDAYLGKGYNYTMRFRCVKDWDR